MNGEFIGRKAEIKSLRAFLQKETPGYWGSRELSSLQAPISVRHPVTPRGSKWIFFSPVPTMC